MIALTLVTRDQEFLPSRSCTTKELDWYDKNPPVSLVAQVYRHMRTKELRQFVAREEEVKYPWWLDSGSKYHITGTAVSCMIFVRYRRVW